MGFTAAQQSASGGDGMTQSPNLAALSAAGVSVWLDDLSRNLLQSGKLRQLTDTRSVVGPLTRPPLSAHLHTAAPTMARSPS
jgi:transaldolase